MLRPGPTVTATAASWAAVMRASARAASTVASIAAACASIANVGTTPPHCLCSWVEQSGGQYTAVWYTRYTGQVLTLMHA